MAREQLTITLKVRVSWWLRVYLAGVRFFSVLTGQRPSLRKVLHWTWRAVRLMAS